MSFKVPKPKANYVPEYQASGIPFIATAAAGVTKTITLSYVTSEVTVANQGTTASTVSFGLANSANFTLPANSTVTFRVKTKKIVVISGASSITSVIASLTAIESGNIPTYDQNDYGSVA